MGCWRHGIHSRGGWWVDEELGKELDGNADMIFTFNGIRSLGGIAMKTKKSNSVFKDLTLKHDTYYSLILESIVKDRKRKIITALRERRHKDFGFQMYQHISFN